jgi:hypothetical protein
MSESEDSWGENDYCDPHDDDQYARDNDDDWEDVAWPEDVSESVKESEVKTETKLASLKERVCRNCKNYDQHIDISFCRCFWDNAWASYLRRSSEDLSEKAKNCEFYKNKYE